MNVICINAQSALHIDARQVKRLVEVFLTWKHIVCDEVIIHFVTKKSISQLHANYFQDPSPTDCITFPIDAFELNHNESNHTVLGEIFICPEVGIEFAAANTLNAYDEVSLYIVHGLLHLLGYDDQDTEDIATMRRAETDSLAYLKLNEATLYA